VVSVFVSLHRCTPAILSLFALLCSLCSFAVTICPTEEDYVEQECLFYYQNFETNDVELTMVGSSMEFEVAPGYGYVVSSQLTAVDSC
jgi:hypothetical protein